MLSLLSILFSFFFPSSSLSLSLATFFPIIFSILLLSFLCVSFSHLNQSYSSLQSHYRNISINTAKEARVDTSCMVKTRFLLGFCNICGDNTIVTRFLLFWLPQDTLLVTSPRSTHITTKHNE